MIIRLTQIRWLGRWLGRRDTPDPAVGFVTLWISVLVILMAGNWVVPVNDIDSAIGAHPNIDRAETAVT